jgi:AcrR family transcriptional regulator
MELDVRRLASGNGIDMKCFIGKFTRAEQKARRPSQILDAAFEEFVSQGYAATRVEDIARRVGVTKGTIYVYFETKEDLFSAMVRHISTPFEDLLASTDNHPGSCAERLRHLIETSYDRLLDNRQTRELLRFVIAEGSRFPHVVDQHHSEFIEPLKRHTQSILDEGIARHEFRDGPAAVAEAVIAPVLSMMIMKLIFDERRPFDRAAQIATHLDLVFNGLAASRPLEIDA